MCGGPKSNLYPFDLEMENTSGISHESCSELLELAATDDLAGFIHEVEEKGSDVNAASFWYCRSFGSKKMGFEERTPLMIASLYGSTEVLKYIVEGCKVDVNKVCGSDGATALHCVAAGGALSCVQVVELLIGAGGDINAVDANGKKAGDLIAPCVNSSSSGKRKMLEMMLNGAAAEVGDGGKSSDSAAKGGSEKEYPMDASLPDINSGVYGSDEFRMYNFKVKTCSRAYTHDWTECPFVHPGENARRRDLRKYNYSCVPCPEFKKGSCGKGDACEYAHGVFESWLHPAQYRTRLCKDETGCSRKVCFFAHKHEELRPLYASTGSAMPSPTSGAAVSSPEITTFSPSMSPCSSPMWQGKVSAMQLSGSRLKTSLAARNMDLDEMAASMPSSPYGLGDLNPTNLEEFLGSLNPSTLSHLQGLSMSPKVNSTANSSAGQIRQNMNHMRASYPASSPARKPTAYSSVSPFSLRSQSFIDRAGVSYRSSSANPSSLMPSKLSDWSSPDGKLDWGFNDEDASKLRKSASFGFRMRGSLDLGMQQHEMMPPWFDQMCMDQEQMVA